MPDDVVCAVVAGAIGLMPVEDDLYVVGRQGDALISWKVSDSWNSPFRMVDGR